jgi:hypothetical protein
VYTAAEDQDFATASNDEDAVLSGHGTGNAANTAGYDYLSNTGDFNPTQLAALQSAGPSGTGAWGNTAPPNFASQYENTPGGAAPLAANATTNPTGLPAPGPPASTGTSGTTGTVAATAPLPLQSFGATPTVTPSYASTATVNPNNTPQYLGQEEAANSASLQPQFQAQDQSEQDQLAARGISSSGAAQDLTNQLYGQQASTLASMNAPAIQQQSGYQQADLTGNAAAINNTNLFNAGEGTAAAGTNAGYYDQALTGNATTYNNYESALEGQGYNTSNEAYTAYLNSFGPNSGVTSGYNGAVAGIGNAATGAYDSSVAGEGAALGAAGSAAGAAIA